MSELEIKTSPVFAPLLGTSRYKGAHGGRASGKSHFFAELAVERCIMVPGTRIVCVREIQKSLKESVKRLLEDKIEVMGVGSQFKVQYDSILTPGGGVIIFEGLVDHTAESIKSLEGFDVGYAEEAQTLTARSLELFIPTIIRKTGSELWFSWNPRHKEDPVDEMFRGANPPENSTVIESNWRDNVFFTEESESVRIQDKLTKPDRYDHIWEGDYEPQATGAIFLSCLCGSELPSSLMVVESSFLSCLCGSELGGDGTTNAVKFLSCLCGSERGANLYGADLRFLSCLCGSELSNERGELKKDFLSCLCGSEHSIEQVCSAKIFLSCLCGSEPQREIVGTPAEFLSCLCGSERYSSISAGTVYFLSCLCGSEPQREIVGTPAEFLSCLCGSEHAEIGDITCSLFLSCLCGSELLTISPAA